MTVPRSLEELVQHQVKRWRVAQERGEPVETEPCVAISRLPYSGGEAVGIRVAEALGYGFFGREIVDQIGREQGVGAALLAGVDERVRNAVDRCVADAFRLHAFTESDYLRHVVRTLTTLGERGMAVILGRGAAFVLAPDKALRVLLLASPEFRAARLAKLEGLGPERAAAELMRLDAERDEFARRQFGVDQLDPQLYDLVLNTGTCGLEAAANLIVEAVRQRFPAGPRR